MVGARKERDEGGGRSCAEQQWQAHLVSADLVFDVVLQQVAEALLVAGGQASQAGFELGLVEDVAHAHAAAGHLGAVGWADALLGGADEGAGQLALLEPVDQLVHVEDDMGAVADVDAGVGGQALCVEGGELVEEAGHMHDAAAADEVDAGRVDEARGQDVEVVGDAVDDDGVAGVVAALGAAAQPGRVGEDVGELALAFVAPLGAEDDGDGHVRSRTTRAGGARHRFYCLQSSVTTHQRARGLRAAAAGARPMKMFARGALRVKESAWPGRERRCSRGCMWTWTAPTEPWSTRGPSDAALRLTGGFSCCCAVVLLCCSAAPWCLSVQHVPRPHHPCVTPCCIFAGWMRGQWEPEHLCSLSDVHGQPFRAVLIAP